MRRSTRLSVQRSQVEPVDGNVAAEKPEEGTPARRTGPKSSDASMKRRGRGSTVKTPKKRGVGKKIVEEFQEDEKNSEVENDQLCPSVVVEQCEQQSTTVHNCDILADNAKEEKSFVVGNRETVETGNESLDPVEESVSQKDEYDSRKDSVKRKNVEGKRGRRRQSKYEGVNEGNTEKDCINKSIKAAVEKQSVCEEEVIASKEKSKEKRNEEISQEAEELTHVKKEGALVKDDRRMAETTEESKDQQEMASFQIITKQEIKKAEVIEITETIKQEDNITTAPTGKEETCQNGIGSTSEDRTKEVISCSESESEPVSVVGTASLKLESINVLPGLELVRKSRKNRTDIIKQKSQKSISRGLGKNLDLGKLKTKLNLSFSKTEGKKSNLLKLTSDAFANLPYKLSKDDLIRKPAKKQSKVGEKTDPIDVHNLDIITLNTDEGKKTKGKKLLLSSELDTRMDANNLYFYLRNSQGPIKDDKIPKKSVLSSDLEKKELGSQAAETMTVTQQKKRRKKDREETAGPGWYNLPKTEVTDDIKKDLQVLKMRHVLNPKRFYKKGETNMSKYFQIGTVVAGPSEFYSSRIPKKERKRTMVDELLADSQFRSKNKKKYLEIQERKESGGKKYYKKMKNKNKETWAKK